jgi:hypothetical protein
MKKIVIVSFYELKDYLLYIKDVFESYHFTVSHYPLFKYSYDAHDKLENYKEHMNEFLKETQPDIILWWFIDVSADVFKYIKQQHKNKIFIMYNSDDPMNLTKELFDRAKIFDIVITPCKETMYLYKLYSNVPVVLFGPMGYDPTLFKQIDSENLNEEFIGENSSNRIRRTEFIGENSSNRMSEFDCDISMIVYNLLDDDFYSSQVVKRKKLIYDIIELCDDGNYKFKLYGTPILKELYPKNYCGEIPYYNLNFLFNSSKINLVSSPFKDKNTHVSEYVMPIIACGGLLLHDKTKHIHKVLNNCVLYDENTYLNKVIKILKNYNKYTNMKNNAVFTAKNYSWDIWVENIVKEIGKMWFDEDAYKKLYDIDESPQTPLEYWLNIGIKKKQICYNFSVPNSFDSETYIEKNNLISESKTDIRKVYLHWYINSKDTIYLKKKICTIANFNPSDYNIIMEDYFNVCSIFNEVAKYNTRDMALKKLNNYCTSTPNIKINDLLNKYVEMIY